MKIATRFIPVRRRRKTAGANVYSALLGAAAGSATAYLLDPACGPARRRRLRQGAQRASRALRDAPSRLTQRMQATTRSAAGEAQSAERRAEEQMLGLRGVWPPFPRLLAGAAGIGLVNYSLARRTVGSGAAGALGLALLARSATNAPLARGVLAEVGRHAQRGAPAADPRQTSLGPEITGEPVIGAGPPGENEGGGPAR